MVQLLARVRNVLHFNVGSARHVWLGRPLVLGLVCLPHSKAANFVPVVMLLNVSCCTCSAAATACILCCRRSVRFGGAQMRDSAKFQLLRALLPALQQEGHRVLLFSQWTSILDLAEWLLQVLQTLYFPPNLRALEHVPCSMLAPVTQSLIRQSELVACAELCAEADHLAHKAMT